MPRTTRSELRHEYVDRKFLFRSIVFATVGIAAIVGIHQLQMHRLDHHLVEQAEKYGAEGDHQRRARYLHAYLQLHRNDPETLAKLAQATDEAQRAHAGQSRGDAAAAIQWYYRALGYLPERLDLRTRLAELLWQTGRLSEAAENADQILVHDPTNAVGLRIRAFVSHQRAVNSGSPTQTAEALEQLAKANQIDPGNHALARALIQAHQSTSPAGVDLDSEVVASLQEVADRLVVTAGDSQSYLIRASLRHENGMQGVDADLYEAAKLAPEAADVWKALAIHAQQLGNLALAEEAYTRLIELDPRDSRGYQGAGDCCRLRGEREAAITHWLAGIEHGKTTPPVPLQLRVAEVQLELGRIDQATFVFERAKQQLDEIPWDGEWKGRRLAWHDTALLLRARIGMQQGHWDEAESSAFPVTISNPLASSEDSLRSVRQQQAWLILAEVYRTVGRAQDSVHAFQQIANIDPQQMTRSLLASAHCMAQVGAWDAAMEHCRRAVRLPNAPTEGWLLFASLQLQRQRTVAPERRDWSQVEAALEQYRLSEGPSWKWALLRAQLQIARNPRHGRQAALAILAHQQSNWPDTPEIWTRLAMFYERLGEPQLADQAAGRVGRVLADPTERQLFATARQLERGAVADARRLIEQIDRSELRADEQQRLDQIERLAARKENDTTQEKRLLDHLIAQNPSNPEPLRRLVELQWDTDRDDPNMDVLIERLAAHEGEASRFVRWWKLRHRLARGEAIGSDLEQLQQDYPHWPAVDRVIAEQAMATGDTMRAAQHFLAASLQDGEGATCTAQGLKALLLDPNPPSGLTTLLAIGRGLFDAGLPSTDAAPTWTVRDQLQEALRQAEAREETAWAIYLAHLLGTYHQTTATDDEAYRERLSHDSSPAAQVVSSAITPDNSDSASRGPIDDLMGLPMTAQHIATTWYSAPATGRHEFEEALADIAADRSDSTASDDSSDQRPDENVTDTPEVPIKSPAHDMLTRAVSMSVVPETRLLQAEQFVAEARWDEATETYRTLIVETNGDYESLKSYAEFAIEYQQWPQLSEALDQMRAKAPTEWDTIVAEAHWLYHVDLAGNANQLIEDSVQEQTRQAKTDSLNQLIWLRAGDLYFDLGDVDRASQAFTNAIEAASDRLMAMAQSFIDSQKFATAYQLCLTGIDTEHDRYATLAMAHVAEGALRAGSVLPGIAEQLDAKLAAYPDDANLAFHVSNVRIQQHRFDDALELLRIVVELDQQHVTAWNNLAALLAERGDYDEAELAISRALGLVRSPLPTLLDTQAVVMIHQGRFAEAVPLLEHVVTSAGAADPRYYFHLAWAYHALGDTERMASAVDLAQKLGLETEFLTQLEQGVYANLVVHAGPKR